MAITKDDIFRVADELDAAGQSPTLAAVRKQLGGGSFTTISEAMTEWKSRRAAKEGPALREPAPQPVAEMLQAVGVEIWALSLDLANGRLASERAALDVARVELEAGKAEAAELADQVQGELEQAQARVAALEAAEQAARAEAEVLRLELSGHTERAAIAEARTVEIEKKAADLNVELARVNGQNGELVKALAATAAAGTKEQTAP